VLETVVDSSRRRYQVPFRFTGKLNKLTIEPKPVPLSDADRKLLMINSQRDNAAAQ
jgi:hypothetical protein